MVNLKKRKIKDTIRGIIGDEFEGSQTDIVNELISKGIKVNQSTVSRVLSELGAVKELNKLKTIYKIPAIKKSYRGLLETLVKTVENNKSVIVIKTQPGSAMFVAGFIDHECQDYILGTVAGDDTLFVAPKKLNEILVCQNKILKCLKNTF